MASSHKIRSAVYFAQKSVFFLLQLKKTKFKTPTERKSLPSKDFQQYDIKSIVEILILELVQKVCNGHLVDVNRLHQENISTTALIGQEFYAASNDNISIACEVKSESDVLNVSLYSVTDNENSNIDSALGESGLFSSDYLLKNEFNIDVNELDASLSCDSAFHPDDSVNESVKGNDAASNEVVDEEYVRSLQQRRKVSRSAQQSESSTLYNNDETIYENNIFDPSIESVAALQYPGISQPLHSENTGVDLRTSELCDLLNNEVFEDFKIVKKELEDDCRKNELQTWYRNCISEAESPPDDMPVVGVNALHRPLFESSKQKISQPSVNCKVRRTGHNSFKSNSNTNDIYSDCLGRVSIPPVSSHALKSHVSRKNNAFKISQCLKDCNVEIRMKNNSVLPSDESIVKCEETSVNIKCKHPPSVSCSGKIVLDCNLL